MKTAFLYVLILGISFACLIVILKIGKEIQAPFNVSGDWSIDKSDLDSIQNSCIQIHFAGKLPKLHIEQSGIHLKAILDDASKTELRGKIKNYELFFSELLLTKSGVKNYCGDKTELRLILELQKQKFKPDILNCTWETPKCTHCKDFHFSAVKTQSKFPEE